MHVSLLYPKNAVACPMSWMALRGVDYQMAPVIQDRAGTYGMVPARPCRLGGHLTQAQARAALAATGLFSNRFAYASKGWMVTPLTTRLTVPVGDGVSGVLLTRTEFSKDTTWPTITNGRAR